MRNYTVEDGGYARRNWPRRMFVLMLLLTVLLGSALFMLRRTYQQQLQPLNASDKAVTITIPLGSTPAQIGMSLKQNNIIRSAWAFEWYVRNHALRDSLQAGTYALRSNQSVEEIVSNLTLGRVATDLFTILPGQRLDQVRRAFLSAGYSEADVDVALNPDTYKEHPALAGKPAAASLEGYLYPDSYQKTKDTPAETIIRSALDEMAKYLNTDIRAGIERNGLSVHEGVVLASVIEMEVSKATDRPIVAQVFLNRLKMGMKLESDPTAKYGAIISGVELPNDPARAAGLAIAYDSPYNTYKYAGLMPGPISNVSKTSLEAVAQPAISDYLYFVAGDDGVTHFSKTLQEHEANTAKYCLKLCNPN